MAKKKKNTHEEKSYPEYSEAASSHIVSEPEFVYGKGYATTAPRPIDIMGASGWRKYATVKNDNDFISMIRAGIPKEVMTHLMAVADISLTEMAAIVHTSDRNLRRYGAHEKLSEEQSERMIELARLYSRGEGIFGSMPEFREWMDTLLLPFGNKRPKEFLDTSLGIAMIMDELGRIQHGIFA